MRILKKMSAFTLAAAMLLSNAGSNLYADNVYVDNESVEQSTNEGYEENFEGDMTIDELEQYFEDVGAEEAKFHNEAEIKDFLIENKENLIESYEYMLKEETDPASLEEIQNTLETLKAELAEYSINSIAESDNLPRESDISTDSATSKYFPNIEDQGESKGSCSPFAICYYMFSYEANRLNNKSSKTLYNCYSPEWGYVQYYHDEASMIGALMKFGAVKWYDFEYSKEANDDKSLSEISENALLDALKTRVNSYRTFQINKDSSPVEDYNSSYLRKIKEIIYKEKKPFFVHGYSNWVIKKTGITNLNNVREDIIVRVGRSETGHSLTIVGYNDNVWCDVNGNGYIDTGERGAFKVANSWGADWGNNGYCWVLYDALNKTSKIKDFDESKYTSVRCNAFIDYFECFNVKAYRPMLIAKLKFEGWNPDKTSVTWGSFMEENKYDKNINLINKGTIPLDAVRLYDFSDSADKVDKLIGNQFFGVKVGNRSTYDKNVYFNKINYCLMDSKKNIIPRTSSYITGNSTVRFDTEFKLGDINYDSKITNTDAQTVLNIASGNTSNYSNLQILLADYNRDGKVDLNDVREVNIVKQ